MIQGVVNARHEAIVRLEVQGPDGVESVEAIVDTGFTSALTLPTATVAALGLVRESGGTAVLAERTVLSLISLRRKYLGAALGGGYWCRPLGMSRSWGCVCWRGTSWWSKWFRVVWWKSFHSRDCHPRGSQRIEKRAVSTSHLGHHAGTWTAPRRAATLGCGMQPLRGKENLFGGA